MGLIPERWLIAFNAEASQKDIPHKERPWQALIEYMRETRSSFDLVDSPEAREVFEWFEGMSPGNAHIFPPLYSGVFFFDASFWRVSIPRCYGSVELDLADSLEAMPRSVRDQLFANEKSLEQLKATWADCIDYALGFQDADLSRYSDFLAGLIQSVDQELRA